MAERMIELRGVVVNNLRRIDLDLPRGELIVVCGVSGSGKTSLALDTLYAEGQRRYIETFSPFTRQFLEQLDKPDAERIDGIPPAIAVTHKNPSRSPRATVGTASEVNDFLALLFARIGEVVCVNCRQKVRRDSPQSAADELARLPPGRRIMIGFTSRRAKGETANDWLTRLSEAGFVRAVVADRCESIEPGLAKAAAPFSEMLVVLDRLTSGPISGRWTESVESAFAAGGGEMLALVESVAEPAANADQEAQATRNIDGRVWESRSFRAELRCNRCGAQYLEPEPPLFHFNRPLGACPVCEGFGSVAPAQTGGETADSAKSPSKRANRRSRASALRSIPCPACLGRRLRPEALAVQVGGRNFAEFVGLQVGHARRELDALQLYEWQLPRSGPILTDINSRLAYLANVGLNYLKLDRPLASLSGGEIERVALTAALGSNLVDVLYVLDEPSTGLHAHDVNALSSAVRKLQARGNTVVVVEHQPEMLRQAGQILEIGPGAGDEGGQVVFQGTLPEMLRHETSLTGAWLAGRRRASLSRQRPLDHGQLTLRGARGHNLQQLDVEFPLGVMCCVTGVSGAGKSTLVKQTLYPALARRLKSEGADALSPPLSFDNLTGTGRLENVMLVDQTPVGRSPRSNPITYLKAFSAIRTLFAEQTEAKARGFRAGHFSFNVEGGRCEACEGSGRVSVDMQFMPDITMRCRECRGRRYRREVLEVKYRGRDIAEVLDMTAREAFTWFRGERAIQARLKPLLDVGLDYLRLGQSAKTLSGGEAQRLKLAAHLAANRAGRTLFLLDEPTIGLHFADVVRLLDCFDALIDVGHSLIVIEHNLQLMLACDHIIDLGPGPAEDGGRIVVTGTPAQVAACAESITGRFLARELADYQAETETA